MTPRRTAFLWLAAGALLVLTGSGGSCSEPARTTSTTPVVPDVAPADLGAPDVRLLVLTDLSGMLEPCGCTSRPLGGIDRLATELASARADGTATVVVAAGDLFFGAAHAPPSLPGAETAQLWKAELVADLLRDFGVAAAAPGRQDFAQGAAVFASLRARAGFPLLGAGVTFEAAPSDAPPGSAAAEPAAPLATHAIARAGEITVGIVGVAELDGVAGARASSDPVAAASTAAAAARAEGATLVIALVSGARRTARRVAEGAEGVDLVVSGGLDEAEANEPATTDGALVLHAGRHGQGLLVVDLFRTGGTGRFRDVSTWTRTAERDRLGEQAADLRERIAAWESDPSVLPADLAAQRERLAELEREIADVARAPRVEGPAISARYVELAPEVPRDPAITARMDAHDVRVNDHNREAFASWLPEPAPAGTPSYVGSEACGGCHADEITWWRGTLHGHAYDTLVTQHKEYSLDCVGCHVTGWMRPGGSTVSHVGPLRDVGCENCHGPGSMHVVDAVSAAVNVHATVDEETCARCHTPDHSDRFVFDTYRRMMIAPGHGLPGPGETGAAGGVPGPHSRPAVRAEPEAGGS